MEAAALARQHFGQQQAAGRRIVAAQRPGQRADGDGQAVPAPQPLGNGVVHLGRPHGQLGAQRLGGVFQRREMVGVVVEDVARFLGRQQDAPPGRQRDAAGILARHPPGPVQRQHRARGRRAAADQGADFGLRHRLGAQQRVGEHLAQLRLQLALLGAGQGGQVDLQGLGELDQQAGGDAALVVLDQVQVAGRDAQPRRQRLLGEAAVLAQAPQRCGRSAGRAICLPPLPALPA